MNRLRLLSLIAICFSAILCLLGATWLDVILQHRRGQSAWTFISPEITRAQRFETRPRVAITFPGTVANMESIQEDLSLSLNNALPLTLFNIQPLFPPAFASGFGLDVSPKRSTHIIIVLWWIVTAAIVAAPILLRKHIHARHLRVLHYLVAMLAIGFLVTYIPVLITTATPALQPLLTQSLYLAGILLVGSSILFSLIQPWNSTENSTGVNCNETNLLLSVSILLKLSISLVLIDLFSIGAMWLGWYTNDIRVNLLEFTPSFVAGLVILLQIAAATLILLSSTRRERKWHLIIPPAALALMAALVPLPPRVATGSELVLLNSDSVVSYSPSSKDIVPLPEQFLALIPNLALNQAEVNSSRIETFGFNSANVYSHIPVSLSWLRPLLMLGALFCISGGLIIAANSVGCIFILARSAVVDRRLGTLLISAAVCSTVLISVFVVIDQIKRSLASHSMERLLLLSPGRFIDPAFTAFAAYYSRDEPLPAYVGKYVSLVNELDEQMFAKMLQSDRIRMQYFLLGAGDWMTEGGKDELDIKAGLLKQASTLNSEQMDLLNRFPTELERTLVDSGGPRGIAAASKANWEGWLSDSLRFLRVQSGEFALHREYIDSLANTPLPKLIRLFEGAVLLRDASPPGIDLPVLKAKSMEATMEVLKSSTENEFMFLSADHHNVMRAANYEGLIRNIQAYLALLQCFSDQAAFTLAPSKKYVQWREGSTKPRCEVAAERLGRAQRGSL